MTVVRSHGRHGLGVGAAAVLLAIAAAMEGRVARATPGFGVRRGNGEMVAFCRIDEDEARPAGAPSDVLVIEDDIMVCRTIADLTEDGYLLVNSGRHIDHLDLPPLTLRAERMVTVPATQIAGRLTGRPVPNAALAGGFAALTGIVSLDSVLTAVRQRFCRSVGKANAAAAMTTFGVVRTEIEERGWVDEPQDGPLWAESP